MLNPGCHHECFDTGEHRPSVLARPLRTAPPGLGLRQFVYRCTGSNDLGDGSSARPTALVTSSRVRRLMASTPQAVVTRPPAVRRAGMQRLSGLWLAAAGTGTSSRARWPQ